MLTILKMLFDQSAFMPHGHCYLWFPPLIWLHLLSDSVIALAYYSIPITLFYLVRNKEDLPYSWILLMFGAFIMACGTTHLMEVITLYIPWYWVSGLVKAITAILSLATALAIVPFVPRVFALRSPVALETVNRRLEKEIEERKRAEEELRRSHQFLDSIFENIPNMVFVKDARDLRFVRFNRAGEELLGYSRKDLIGKNDYDFFPKQEADFFQEKDREVLTSGKLFDIPEEWIHTNLKGSRLLHTKKIPVLDQHAKPQYLLGISEDITERKQAENEICKLNDDLKRNAFQLEMANRELEAFNYSVSHDLRAPLRAVDGFSKLLLDDHAGQLNEEGRQYLGTIRENTLKMTQLIDDLMAFSQMGRQHMASSHIDMQEMVKSIVEEIKSIHPEQKPEFRIFSLPQAFGDASMIRQAWVNLLSNAVKFTKKKESARIDVGGHAYGKEDVYYVKDNGAGFDMAQAERLFVAFQRLHATEEFEGTGVGLAIVQRVVTRHGGRVWAEGEVHRGATFHFSLPRKGN